VLFVTVSPQETVVGDGNGRAADPAAAGIAQIVAVAVRRRYARLIVASD